MNVPTEDQASQRKPRCSGPMGATTSLLDRVSTAQVAEWLLSPLSPLLCRCICASRTTCQRLELFRYHTP